MIIKEYAENEIEYIAYYEITGYNMEENQDDYIVKELPGWFNIIKRDNKNDINIVPNKIIFGIHSEYLDDVKMDYVLDAIADIAGNTNLIVNQIPVPALYRDEKWYVVDTNEFADRETMEDYWNNSFVGWEDADVGFPTTFNKFIKQCLKDGFARTVQEVMKESINVRTNKSTITEDANNRSYMYFTKLGIGPGMLPRDVKIVDWYDVNSNITVIYVDRALTTDELSYYDIYPETVNNKLLDKYNLEVDEVTGQVFAK